MSIDDLTTRYKLLNNSYDKRFVFQVSRGVGYCAEMIGLLKTIQMCLCTQTQLCLGRSFDPPGYAFKNGWEDYFLPIFPYQDGRFLQQLNRPNFPYAKRFPLLKNVSRMLLKVTSGDHYYMFDKKEWHYSAELVEKKLLLQGDYWSVVQQLINAIFRYREEVVEGILDLKQRLELPKNNEYVAVHIRRGDKITEASYTELEFYAEALHEHALDKLPIYIATDDHSVIKNLQCILGNNFSIIEPITKKFGYDQAKFNHQSSLKRWEDTLFFLFELDVMINSLTFMGSSSSNIFYWVRYNRANLNLVDVKSHRKICNSNNI